MKFSIFLLIKINKFFLLFIFLTSPEGKATSIELDGPFDVIMPEDQEPPNGYWHEILGAEDEA